jgi:hypothetical protein
LCYNICMSKQKLIVLSASRGSGMIDKGTTKFYDSVKRARNTSSVPSWCVYNNTTPLANVYNNYINKYKDKYEWIVLVHDDVYMPHLNNLSTILDETDYDVVGLAGSKTMNPKEPALWHLMSPREDYVGAVSHPIKGTDQHFVTSFGPLPSRSLVVDGLFIGIRTESLTDNMRFDESNPGKWHHYDLDFCLTCNKENKKVGVIDFPLVHNSPGLLSLDDEAFKKSQKWFLDKWRK